MPLLRYQLSHDALKVTHLIDIRRHLRPKVLEHLGVLVGASNKQPIALALLAILLVLCLLLDVRVAITLFVDILLREKTLHGILVVLVGNDSCQGEAKVYLH